MFINLLYKSANSFLIIVSKFFVDYTHLTDDTSISQQLKYPDQLDPEDVTTPASLHVLHSKQSSIVTRQIVFCSTQNCDRKVSTNCTYFRSSF